MKICICSGGLYFEDSNGKEYAAEYEELANAYIKQDKYPWHDLRKNPEDLPIFEGLYLCVIERWGSGEFDKGLDYEYTVLKRYGMMNLKDFVIAWRHVEPFEGDEDE